MNNRFKSLCRVCLVDSSSNMRSLVDEQTRAMLYECTSVWVEPGDNYPQQMCNKCWNRCRDWSDFKTLAQDNDRQLKTEVKEKQLDDEENGVSTVLVELKLENDEEDELKTDAEVEIEKGNMSMDEGDTEEVLDEWVKLEYSPNEDEEEGDQDTIVPLVANAVADVIVKEKKKRKRPVKVTTRNHKCRYCSKAFPTLSHLKRHEGVHSDERLSQCDECGETFKQYGHLKPHKLIHSGVKAFECDECNKKFTQKGDLMRHKLIHSGVREFECRECDKKFIQKGDLITHKLIHSGVKAFECEQCNKKFTRKSQLNQHKKSHSEKRPFECIECESSFKYPRDLKNHLKKKHQFQ